MKKLIYLSLLLSTVVVFDSCKKANSEVKGCMDPTSISYNAKATVDDGSCQYLASSATEKRNAVLEEYTGVRCTFCPDGHRKAQAFADANPGKVVLINVHTGSYATPQSGWPDFTTSFGAGLASISGLAGYPAGSMNRNLFPGGASASPYYKQGASSIAISRGGFAAAGAEIMKNNSPVNVGFKTEWNESTRELKVIAEAYFTQDIANGTLLNVALLENNVIGKQIDAGVYNDNYVHKHMLRHLLTGQWGDAIAGADAKTGKRIQKTYTYTVPSSFKIENCEVAVFATQSDKLGIFTGTVKNAK